jgi:superfamily II DNA/RNA helicase
MTFAQLNLDPKISRALDGCGYTKPTPIQARCIPDILNGKDMVASAQTGTGKTAAFVLPSLHRLSVQTEAKGSGSYRSKAKPRILILTPTRELASQITQAASTYGKFMQFKIISLVGGMSYHQQIQKLSGQVDIVVATPGRLLDHMRSKRIDLSNIEILIFDEADRMLDMGFIDDVKAIAKTTPQNRQTLLFSATVDGKLDSIIKQLLKNPVRIDLSEEKMAPAKIKQEIYMTDNDQHKGRLLKHFMSDKNVFKAIIFTATKINADKLARQLRDNNYPAAALHGDLKQNVRNRTLDQLRQGRIQFLVATDVAARGIDVSDITHVFNYDLPKFSEDYVHRIGRTGRAGRTGIAISFALPSDGRHIKQIERYIGQTLPLSVIEGMEPTKRFEKSAPAAKRFGKGKSFGKSSASKGSFDKGSASGNKSSFGKNSKKRFWFKEKSKAKTH